MLAVSIHEKRQHLDVFKGLTESQEDVGHGSSVWEPTAAPRFFLRITSFSKAHGQDGITGPNPGEDQPRAASFSERWQSLLWSGSALSFCRKLNHFDGGNEGD